MQYLTFKSNPICEFLSANSHGEFRSILSNYGISLNGDTCKIRLFDIHHDVSILTEAGILFGKISPEGMIFEDIIMVTKEDLDDYDMLVSYLGKFNKLTYETYHQFDNRFYLKYKLVDSHDTDGRFILHTVEHNHTAICIDIDFSSIESEIMKSMQGWYNDHQLSKIRSDDCRKVFGIRMNENLRRMGASESIIYAYWKYITDKSKLNSIDFYNIVSDSEFNNQAPDQLNDFLSNVVMVDPTVIADLVKVKNYLSKTRA